MRPEMIEVNSLGLVERICLFSLSVIAVFLVFI
jgi:hypothetical protein